MEFKVLNTRGYSVFDNYQVTTDLYFSSSPEAESAFQVH